jgi:alkylation response protein AidB-like acyl-CoA dehydrogenase
VTVQPVSGSFAGGDDLRRFRTDLLRWCQEHEAGFVRRTPGASLEEEVARTRANQRFLWESGWLRYGWPESVGGYGGDPILRTIVAEEAAARELFIDVVYAVVEVLVPTVIQMAPSLSALAQQVISGQLGWCQGFSEPDAGSDLASLRCRAVDEGDHWVVSGQKIWTSYAQFAEKIVLLARTGTIESRHRGITAMLVDMDWPGVSVRPLHSINDAEEFSETFFDDVRVPKDRVIGQIDGGWKVAMNMLSFERGGIFWMLSRWMLNQVTEVAHLASDDDRALGHALASAIGARARSWTTQHRIAAGTIETPETSIDKILMGAAEQEVFDLALASAQGAIEFGDAPHQRDLRAAYMYSRAASIYGGTAEIQRNIVADQLLELRGL